MAEAMLRYVHFWGDAAKVMGPLMLQGYVPSHLSLHPGLSGTHFLGPQGAGLEGSWPGSLQPVPPNVRSTSMVPGA